MTFPSWIFLSSSISLFLPSFPRSALHSATIHLAATSCVEAEALRANPHSQKKTPHRRKRRTSSFILVPKPPSINRFLHPLPLEDPLHVSTSSVCSETASAASPKIPLKCAEKGPVSPSSQPPLVIVSDSHFHHTQSNNSSRAFLRIYPAPA